MRKPTIGFLVAAVAVAAGFCGQAAMACAPGQPPVPAACHIPTNEGGIRDGTCSCVYGVATKSAAGTYWAKFILSPSRSVSLPVGDQGPSDWITTYTGWSDAGAYSQEFSVWYSPSDLSCTATAQPGSADFVAAAVVYQGTNGVVVRERWTGSSSNHFYSDPVVLTCRPTA